MEIQSETVHAVIGGARAIPESKSLTVDTTVRSITLPAGAYRLYGSAAGAVFYATRPCKSDGTLEGPGVTAPTTGQLAAATAGSPAAGKAWDTANGSVVGSPDLSTDATQWEVITVPVGAFKNLYVRIASGSTVVKLVGPFEG
jgi:hypothetical protein